MSLPTPPTRDEMGPHAAEGAWRTWLLIVRTRYSLFLILLAALSLGTIYSLALRLSGDKERAALPVPLPTPQSRASAEHVLAAAVRAREERGVFFATHPELRAEARREGFIPLAELRAEQAAQAVQR